MPVVLTLAVSIIGPKRDSKAHFSSAERKKEGEREEVRESERVRERERDRELERETK